MKRLLAVLFLIALGKVCSGQDVGFHIGVNFANQVQEQIPNDLPEYGSVGGLRVGVDLNRKLSRNLNFITGLTYNQKGANGNWNFNETGFVYKIRSNLNYLELPVSILLCNTDIIASPFVSVGVYGAWLVSGNFAPPSNRDAKEYIGPYDYGIKLTSGFKLGRFWLVAGYDFGLENVMRYTDRFIIKNRNLNFSVKYFPEF